MASLHNDEPTIADQLDRSALVKKVGDVVAHSRPPLVLGVHGDWGAGKTSFLHQLQLYLTGECPQHEPDVVKRVRDAVSSGLALGAHKEELVVIWFEAWRYQHETAPVVALLQEIRAQLPLAASWLRWSEKMLDITVRSAFLSLDELTKKIGLQTSKIEERADRWERDNLAVALPSHTVRQHLDKALGDILGKTEGGGWRRLVVLIDDLDRCEPETAYKLLEGIKIYLNLPSCVFVLGMNQRIIEGAIAKVLGKDTGAEVQQRSREYLEKICQNIWHLPLVRAPAALVHDWLGGLGTRGSLCSVLATYRCIPANPRKIKAFANVLQRFAEHTGYQASLADPEADTRYAMFLVAMASLYQFHPEIYRQIEANPAFVTMLVRWCRNKARDTAHPVLRALEPMLVLRDKTEDGPDAALDLPELVSAHADPVHGNVLRIQKLLIDLDDGAKITEPDVERFLLR